MLAPPPCRDTWCRVQAAACLSTGGGRSTAGAGGHRARRPPVCGSGKLPSAEQSSWPARGGRPQASSPPSCPPPTRAPWPFWPEGLSSWQDGPTSTLAFDLSSVLRSTGIGPLPRPPRVPCWWVVFLWPRQIQLLPLLSRSASPSPTRAGGASLQLPWPFLLRTGPLVCLGGGGGLPEGGTWAWQPVASARHHSKCLFSEAH